MAGRRPWGQMIPTRDGYVQLYEDGSVTIFDHNFNVVRDDPTPNPARAALAHAGQEEAAAIDAANRDSSRENTRRWDLTHADRRQQTRNQRDEIRSRLRMDERRLGYDRERDTADRAQREAEFARTHGLNQARLGYDLVRTGAELRGPSNYYQAAEYARGVSQMPQTSTFLSALQNNTRLADYGAQGGLPERETIGTLTQKLLGGSGVQNGAPGVDNTLAQIGNIGAKGAHQLGAGALEQLTPTELGLFTSGLDRLGLDKDTFLSQYRRSRIGQGDWRAA